MEQSYSNSNRDLNQRVRFKYFGDPKAAKVSNYIKVAVNSRGLLSRRGNAIYRKNPHSDLIAQSTWFSFRIYLERMAFFKIEFLNSLMQFLDLVADCLPLWIQAPQTDRKEKAPRLLDYGVTVRACEPVNKLYS